MEHKYPKRGFVIPSLILIVILWAILTGENQGGRETVERGELNNIIILLFLCAVIVSLILLVIRNMKRRAKE